jgi:hypothetical protein
MANTQINANVSHCVEHKRKVCQPFALCKGAEQYGAQNQLFNFIRAAAIQILCPLCFTMTTFREKCKDD